MSRTMALALVCSVILGLGLWSLVSMAPRLSRPRLIDRVAPYIMDVSENARLHAGRRTVNPLPVLGTLFSPAFHATRSLLAALLGGGERIQLRLAQSASTLTLERYRSEQLVWSILGFAVGVAVVLITVPVAAISPAVRFVIPLLAAALGLITRDWLLARAAARRVARVASELPTVLEFLTLSLSAGEGVLDSFLRVAQVSSGELSREFAIVVADVHTGVPFAQALNGMVLRVRLPALNRCAEQITAALERGAPLAGILRAQAQDSRDEDKRNLLEVAGKKEVAMLVPLVFFILPATIVFAIFPGIFVLQSGF